VSASKKVCAVVGVGPGNGAAIARRFAKEGYAVALLARGVETSDALAKELGGARAYACDVTDEAAVAAAFDAIAKDLGPVDAVVYNAGSGAFGTFDDVDAAALDSAFRVNTLGLFHVAKRVVPTMKQRGGGSLVVIGATASRRGAARTAAFAPAKAAQRSLCESMARHLWPQKIHVSLIVVDGVVDLPRTRARLPDKPDAFFIAPDAVAAIALQLATQDPAGWSFEVEARPFGETW
jgi:NAD(P)-dependent dehydrogenase (short-subunit alcohol dehydrogenase family)